MIERKNILRLYRTLDKYQEKLAKQEPYWKKCNPCKNKGQCCIDSNTVVLSSEFRIIKNYIRKLTEDEKDILKYNINNDIICPFRAEKGCIIHDVRPLTCRVTPYLANLRMDDNNKIEYLISSEDCTGLTRCEQDILSSKIDEYKSELFVDLNVSYIQKRKYLNADYLKINQETYLKMCKEKPVYAIDFLKNEYDSLFK